jgi:methionyl-tRNA formyltransferase
MEAGRAVSRPQAGEASYCGIIGKEEGLVDWSRPALEIDAKIRAFYPWPVTYTWLGASRLNLLEARPYPGEKLPPACGEGARPGRPGEVLALDKTRGIMVQTGDGLLALRRLQLQTKKALPFREFANGVRGLLGLELGIPAVQETGPRP